MADPQKPTPDKGLYEQTRADVARPTPTPSPGNLYGSTLADKVPTTSPGGAASPYQIVPLSAVGYAHRNNISHRDSKPANVLLNDQWEPKLADFGLARQMDLADEGKTTAGAQLLSLGYGAPEQEIDASRADHRADLYAVGA